MKQDMRVRLVDDDTDLLQAQCQTLRIAGFIPEPFSDARSALDGLTSDYPGVILSDVRMPYMDGLEFHEKLRTLDPELPVILLTGHGDVDMAVRAMRNGAWDFLTKPVSSETLTNALRRACHARALVLENRLLRQMAPSAAGTDLLLGNSPAMVHLRESAERLAEAGADVLITGASGTGKEALARAIHAAGPKKGRGFVHIACDALDPDRFEEDFIGTEAGLGGARQARRVGRLEKAHRGVLFLDAVDRLPLALQGRLLNLIETGELWVKGAVAARPFQTQVIAATRADLAGLVATGAFRSDLFYRLSAVTVRVPTLVERKQDISLLFRHFLLRACARHDQPVPRLSPVVQAHLQTHDWPGNMRELDHYATSLALGLDGNQTGLAQTEDDLSTLLSRYEAAILRATLEDTQGHATEAMTRLGLSRKTFYDRLQRHDLKPADFRLTKGEA